MKKTRNYNLDILRILATFLVIVNHTNSQIFLGAAPSTLTTLSVAYFFISKIAVALFFIISGALLLPKEEDYKTVFYHRFLPIVIATIVFSMVYYLYPMVRSFDFSSFSLKFFISSIIQKPFRIPFWYLYTYAALMLALPFIRKMVKNMNALDHKIFIFLSILFGSFFNFMNTTTGYRVSTYADIGIFQMFIGYLVIGNYLFNIKKKESFNLKGALISLLVFTSTIIFSVWFTMRDYYRLNEYVLRLDSSTGFLIVIGAICIVLIVQFLSTKISFSDSTKKLLVSVSKTTFAIFLIHELLITIFHKVYLILSLKINPLLAMLIYQIVVFTVGFALVSIYQATVTLLKSLLKKKNNGKTS